MAKILNVIERQKNYTWNITPKVGNKNDNRYFLSQKTTPFLISHKNDNGTYKRVEEYLSSHLDWKTVNFLDCLEELSGRSKLFCYKQLTSAQGKTLWECYTYKDSFLVTAQAPTKVEAYRVALIAILKEFYYFPFNEQMELPAGKISAFSLFKPQFCNQLKYLPFPMNDMEMFYLKENAYNYLKKLTCDPDKVNAEELLANISPGSDLQYFEVDSQMMVKLSQHLYIDNATDKHEFAKKAVKKFLEIDQFYNLTVKGLIQSISIKYSK